LAPTLPVDPDLLSAYEEESQTLATRVGQTTCWITLAVVPAFTVLDRWIVPEHPPVLLAFRLACMAIVGVVLWLFGRPVGRRHAYALFLVIALVAGFTVDVIALLTGGGASPRSAGLYLIIIGGAVLVPWPATWSALAGTLVVASYAALMVVADRVGDRLLLVTHVVFLTAATAVGVFATAFRECLRWREFASRTALTTALRQRAEFIAKMSHELRTPLNVSIGYADMMLEDLLPPDAQELRDVTARIRSQAVLLNRLISDLLDYSKAQAGKLDVEHEPVDVVAVVREVAAGFKPLVARGGLRLDVDCEPGLEPIASDGKRIEQILLNLVANAAKFTPEGGVTIAVRAIRPDDPELARITVLADPLEGRPTTPAAGVAVLVRDTGIGIRPEDLRRLAVDFEQTPGTESRYGGTGLGLSICRRFARLLGGCVGVASEPGRGSVFALFLPRSEARVGSEGRSGRPAPAMPVENAPTAAQPARRTSGGRAA
jgi:signal transduction histidine kinase